EARATGYRPLVAEALLALGHATMSSSPREQSIPALSEAMSVALAVGADAQAIEAWARRAWLMGSDDDADPLAGLDVMAPRAARTPSPFARALLHNNVGGVELEREHRDRARAEFERALDAARGVSGPGAVELLNVRLNLARVTDDAVRRDRMLADAESE